MINHHFKVLLDDHYKLFQHVSHNKIPKPTTLKNKIMQPNRFQVIVWHTTIYDPIVLQYIFALLPIYISQKRWDWLILKLYVHQYRIG